MLQFKGQSEVKVSSQEATVCGTNVPRGCSFTHFFHYAAVFSQVSPVGATFTSFFYKFSDRFPPDV